MSQLALILCERDISDLYAQPIPASMVAVALTMRRTMLPHKLVPRSVTFSALNDFKCQRRPGFVGSSCFT
jgi:hypothetical protein